MSLSEKNIELRIQQLQDFLKKYNLNNRFLLKNDVDLFILYFNESLTLESYEISVQILEKLINYLRNSGQYLIAIDHYEKFLNQFELQKDEHTLEVLCQIGAIFRRIGDFKRSKIEFNVAFKISKEINKSRIPPTLSINYSALLISLRDYSEAFIHLDKALQILDKNSDGAAVAKTNIASIFSELGDTDKAIELYLEAADVITNHKEQKPNYFITIFSNTGFILGTNNRSKEAKIYLKEAIQTAKNINNIQLSLYPKIHLSYVYLKEKKFKKALQEIDNVFDIIYRGNDIRLKIDLILYYSKCLIETDQKEKALKIIKENYELFDHSKLIKKKRELLKIQYSILKNKKNKDDIFSVMDQIVLLNDLIEEESNKKNRNKIDMLTKIKSIKEKLLLEKKINEKNNEMNLILQKKNKELDNFVSIATHDLRSPIRTINSFGKLLEKKNKLDPEYLGFILKSSEQMESLLDKLSDFAKVGISKIDLKEIDLNKIIKSVLILLHYNIEEKKAIITFDNLPNIIGDKDLIKLLFQNLIQNAIKYTDKKKTPFINISSEIIENNYIITVQDNGLGIPQKDLIHIFEPFIRSEEHQEFEGTGIGLATCQKIAKVHNGEIKVSSILGEGSQFKLLLPKINS